MKKIKMRGQSAREILEKLIPDKRERRKAIKRAQRYIVRVKTGE